MCDAELTTVNNCVSTNAASCGCIDTENFAADAENAFKSTLAFKTRDDPEFCVEANFRTCKPFYPPSGAMSCCCNEETEAYMNCKLTESWLTQFSIADSDCVFDYSCYAVNNGGLDDEGNPPSGSGG